MPLKFIPTNVKYNDSGEFKNISIPADRAYMNEAITVSSTQPTSSDNKLWINTNEQTKQTYQIPTVSESLALGINNASVGDIIRVSGIDSLGKPTSWQHVSLNEIICNKNLLDNWYFVGGGSQLGAGVFPINQRGQTSYSATGYKIDRWSLQRGSISLQDGGMLCTSPTDNTFRFDQRLPYGTIKDLLGKTCTLSALVNDTLCVYTTTVSEAELTKSFVVDGVDCSLDLNFVAAWGTVARPVQFFVGSGKSAVLKAVKLELGSYQTLAHNEGTEENPNWVLNEIPDYGEELAKCQRYYIKFDRYIASGFLTNSGKEYNIPIYLPITMAGTPTVTMSGYVARTPNGYSAHTGGSWTAPTTLGVYFPNNGFVLLADTINSAVDTNNIQINYYIKDLVLTV